jgi:hypothetical protein
VPAAWHDFRLGTSHTMPPTRQRRGRHQASGRPCHR